MAAQCNAVAISLFFVCDFLALFPLKERFATWRFFSMIDGRNWLPIEEKTGGGRKCTSLLKPVGRHFKIWEDTIGKIQKLERHNLYFLSKFLQNGRAQLYKSW